IRCIFGNPFRPMSGNPEWLTPNVLKLAESIYDDRASDCLPILADALEDAGCDNADILAHCRGPGPHVRGCWVIDLLLGKECACAAANRTSSAQHLVDAAALTGVAVRRLEVDRQTHFPPLRQRHGRQRL